MVGNEVSTVRLGPSCTMALREIKFSRTTDEIKTQYEFNSRHKSEPRQVCLVVEPGRDQLRCLR